jgi:hypothetical protein
VGNEYCCYQKSTARYSNTVCNQLSIPPENPPPPPDDGLSFDDYILIFADEAVFPSARNVFGYVFENGRPNSYWYEDMDNFKALYENQKIDINKILIFHVALTACGRAALAPYVDVRAGYEMPIPDAQIIETPRNAPRCRVNGEDLTGAWIDGKIKDIVGQISPNLRVNIFVDDSPSLTWEAVQPGITAYQNIAIEQGLQTRTILCRTERWLRWIVSAFNKNPICS